MTSPLYSEPKNGQPTQQYEHLSVYDFVLNSSHDMARRTRNNINNLRSSFSVDPDVLNKIIGMLTTSDNINFLSAYTELLAAQFFRNIGYNVTVLDANKNPGAPDLLCTKLDKTIYVEVTSLHAMSAYSRFERQLFTKINTNLRTSDYTRKVILSCQIKASMRNFKQSKTIKRLYYILEEYNESDQKRINNFGLPRHTLFCEHICDYCKNFSYGEYHKCQSCYYLNCELVPNSADKIGPIIYSFPLKSHRDPVHERIFKRLRDKSKSKYPVIPVEHPYILVLGLYDNICLDNDLDILRGLYGYYRVNDQGLIPGAITEPTSISGRWISRHGRYMHSSTAGLLVFNNSYPDLTEIDYMFYANPGDTDQILNYPGLDAINTKYINESDFSLAHKLGFNFNLDLV